MNTITLTTYELIAIISITVSSTALLMVLIEMILDSQSRRRYQALHDALAEKSEERKAAAEERAVEISRLRSHVEGGSR